MSDQLPPAGIGLVADAGLRRVDRGRLLIGGSPLRIIRLSEAGAAVLDAWLSGTPLAAVKSARGLARRLLDAGVIHPVVKPAVAPPPVSVIVPAWGDPEALAALLPTIGQPTLVVDDASTFGDDLRRVAETAGAVVVRRETNGGPGAARMTGVAETTGEFIVFVDTDVVLPDDWWAALAPYFDDPAVVAVAPRVRSAPGPSLRERYESSHSSLDIGDQPGNVGPKRALSYVPSAMLAVRRSALDQAGGFDPALRVGEDVDLIWRLTETGTVRYAPSVEVHHMPRSTWIGVFRQRVLYGSSAAPLTERHGSVVAPARCSRWSLAAWGSAVGGHPVAGLAMGVASSVALVRKLDGVPGATKEAARIAGWGQLQAGRGLARAVSRVWWPIVIPTAVVSRRMRPGVVAAMVLPAAWDWWKGNRPADPVRSVGLRIADDMAYGVGVWSEMIRRRDYRALAPDLAEWPGRRDAVETDTVSRP